MYHIELGIDEIKILAGILGSYIYRNEMDEEIKEYVEAARSIFQKVINAKEQWHDLRKDPNDLPKKHNKLSDRSDVVITDKGTATYHFIYRRWYVHSSECDLSFPGTVIAWCEIPTFDKEIDK